MILESPVALVGIVLQWSTCLLLLLLFFRLGQVGTHRRMLWTWAVVWGGQLVATTGFTVQAIAALSGRPFADARSLQWLDGIYVPGTLLFLALLALGAAQATGRHVSFALERAAILAAIGVGLLAVLVDQAALTGILLVVITAMVGFVGGVRILGAERRLDARRFLLPAAMALLGVVMITYQLVRHFGVSLDPFGDFTSTILTASGYTGAVAAAILGAAVVVHVAEDSFRARRYLQQERIRELASSQALLVASRRTADRAGETERWMAEAGPDLEPASIAEVIAVAVELPRPAPTVADAPTPLRAPALVSRTETLPRPARRADGSTSEALLVDDEAASRSTLARIFQRGGWNVREAATGAEALSWLLGVDPRESPAVILCELKLPGLGGRELYQHLQEQRPEFLERLIFITDDVDGSTAEFIRASECPVIHKPVTVEEVARAVERVSA